MHILAFLSYCDCADVKGQSSINKDHCPKYRQYLVIRTENVLLAPLFRAVELSVCEAPMAGNDPVNKYTASIVTRNALFHPLLLPLECTPGQMWNSQKLLGPVDVNGVMGFLLTTKKANTISPSLRPPKDNF